MIFANDSIIYCVVFIRNDICIDIPEYEFINNLNQHEQYFIKFNIHFYNLF